MPGRLLMKWKLSANRNHLMANTSLLCSPALAVEQQDTVVDIPIHTQAVVVGAVQVVLVLTTVQHTEQEQAVAQGHVVCVVIETHHTATDVAVTQDTHTKQAVAAMAAC